MNPRFFFGANTRYGFRGFLSGLYNPKTDRVILVKGSPGSGKNTMMRRVRARLAREGIPYEEIRCSSDPASLDGLIAPTLKKAIFDATAPHVMEPQFWGACETLADLSRYLRRETLTEHRAQLAALCENCARLHRKSCAELAKAAFVYEEFAAAREPERQSREISRAAGDFAQTYFPKAARSAAPTRERRFFLSAAAPGEIAYLSKTPECYASKRVVFEDPFYLCAPLFMNLLRELAAERGLAVIRCANPAMPQVIDHLIFPELSLAVSVSSPFSPCGEGALCCADFFPAPPGTPPIFPERYLRRACEFAKEAKEVHDRIEAIYGAAMDFSAAEEEARRAERFFVS